MDPTLATCLRSWTFDPWLLVPLSGAAGLYLRGWWRLHRQRPQRFGGLSALEDQVAAGVLMWVPGSLAYLVPMGVLVMQLLNARSGLEIRRQVSGEGSDNGEEW
jgi:cytochrome c oxidase assembly factor CtaG